MTKSLKRGCQSLILFCLCLSTVSGCASLAVRTGKVTGKGAEGLYAGTRQDVAGIGKFAKDMVDPEIAPFAIFISPFGIAFCIADGALSTVLDTACLPYDLTHKSGQSPKPVVQLEERPEIQKMRQLWPQGCFRGDVHLSEGPWLCNVVMDHPTLERYRQCHQVVLDCGWQPDDPASQLPTSIPGPFTTIPQSFHKDGRTLIVSYMDCGVRLRSK